MILWTIIIGITAGIAAMSIKHGDKGIHTFLGSAIIFFVLCSIGLIFTLIIGSVFCKIVSTDTYKFVTINNHIDLQIYNNQQNFSYIKDNAVVKIHAPATIYSTDKESYILCHNKYAYNLFMLVPYETASFELYVNKKDFDFPKNNITLEKE